MNELLASAMASSKQIMQAQAVNTNNLANASTTGFRAELAFVTSQQSGGGVYSTPDLSPGAVKTTGRSLDVAIAGEGWFSITAQNGTEAFSRRGDFHVDSFGQLSDGSGNAVMGNSGPIALPPYNSIEIGTDGTISIVPLGQTPNTMAVVDRIQLVTVADGGLERGDDGLMRLKEGVTATADASVKVVSGSLEGSNVSVVTEMINMIDLARRFESQVQLMRSAEENSSALAKIMSMS